MASARLLMAKHGVLQRLSVLFGRLMLIKDEKRDPLGDSALWTAIPQLIENTIDML